MIANKYLNVCSVLEWGYGILLFFYWCLNMNDYEVTKLKKELQRKQELLKEEREDRENTEKRLVLIQAVTAL